MIKKMMIKITKLERRLKVKTKLILLSQILKQIGFLNKKLIIMKIQYKKRKLNRQKRKVRNKKKMML